MNSRPTQMQIISIQNRKISKIFFLIEKKN